MQIKVKHFKVTGTLPTEPEANSLYFVYEDGKVTFYVTDENGEGLVPEAAAVWGAIIGDLLDQEDLAEALDAKANLDSPAFLNNPTAPTQSPGNNTTRLATTAFVTAAIAAIIGGSPGALDTLNELAAALNDDDAFATTVTNALAAKVSKARTAIETTTDPVVTAADSGKQYRLTDDNANFPLPSAATCTIGETVFYVQGVGGTWTITADGSDEIEFLRWSSPDWTSISMSTFGNIAQFAFGEVRLVAADKWAVVGLFRKS